MFNKNKALTIFAVLLCLNGSINSFSFAQKDAKAPAKYPDYAYEYLGKDKFENFNRKVFIFNGALNKVVIRPIHIVWASIMPKYGMDRIKSAYDNIEYPRRLASSLIQKDFKTSKKETLRFLTNSTIGLGGLYDPAKRYFNLSPAKEDMQQALCKCKIKQGPYLVIPIISSSSPRDVAGRVLDSALDPSCYIGTPILAIVKAGLVVNRTCYMQPLFKMIESTYADPYEITKKLYGLETYIKQNNLDRKEVLETTVNIFTQDRFVNNLDNIKLSQSQEDEEIYNPENSVIDIKHPLKSNSLYEQIAAVANIQDDQTKLNIKNSANSENNDKIAINDLSEEPQNVVEENSNDDINMNDTISEESNLSADITFADYNPQTPVVDSMRTALFELPNINNSIWTELSVWNRCFSKKIKTSSVKIVSGRDNYKFKYILQKDKTSPVAIIYPSIGEGITSHHSVVLAKLFFDEGYSVIIQGSHFQWEFVKSMPSNYRPGIPANDAEYLRRVTSKILASLQEKHNCKFRQKVIIGTSFGALTTLFLAEKENKNNTMNITKYIAINPPIELMYSMKQIDKNSEEWSKNPSELKDRVAVTAAKILQLAQDSEEVRNKPETLPFSEDEAKMITGFIMHQKLSDLVFTLENTPVSRKTDFYTSINNMGYDDYAKKYLLNGKDVTPELEYDSSLYSISNFLEKNRNYKIYHSLDDYLVNHQQLKKLKKYAGDNAVFVNNGGHLGFLYRQEFINELKNDISLKKKLQKNSI